MDWLIYGLCLLLITGPLLSAFTAEYLGKLLGCRVDESNAHPCERWGYDWANVLYGMFLMGWLAIFTGPLGILLAVVYSVILYW